MPPQFQSQNNQVILSNRTLGDTISITAIIFYGLLLLIFGILEWNRSSGWELATIGIVILVICVALIYTLIIGILGWKKFKNLEMGFILGFISNWFFVFAVITKHSVLKGLYTLFSTPSLAIIPMVPFSLLYLIRVIMEYRQRGKNNTMGRFLFYRFIILSIFLIIIMSGQSFLGPKVLDASCREIRERDLESGLITLLPPYCNSKY